MHNLTLVLLLIAYSHYWPPLGGVNGSPTAHTASGEHWQDWVGQGAACPPEWPFGTVIIMGGHEWVCIDRGSAVKHTSDGRPIVDFLEEIPRYGHRTALRVYVRFGTAVLSPHMYNRHTHVPIYQFQ